MAAWCARNVGRRGSANPPVRDARRQCAGCNSRLARYAARPLRLRLARAAVEPARRFEARALRYEMSPCKVPPASLTSRARQRRTSATVGSSGISVGRDRFFTGHLWEKCKRRCEHWDGESEPVVQDRQMPRLVDVGQVPAVPGQEIVDGMHGGVG